MSLQYFSERQMGPRARTEEVISKVVWEGIMSLIQRRLADNSFGYAFPAQCPDSHVTCGVDENAFSQAICVEVPDLSWPPSRRDIPHTLAILDLIEFCYRSIAKPIPIHGGWHGYFQHQHLDFEEAEGKQAFQDDVNRIFSRNGLAYELTPTGEIQRLGPEIIRQHLHAIIFHTGDTELDHLLETARMKFFDPDLAVRKDALEKLWDAWERLKTLEVPGEGNKKVSAQRLLEKAALTEPKFLTMFQAEAEILTCRSQDFI